MTPMTPDHYDSSDISSFWTRSRYGYSDSGGSRPPRPYCSSLPEMSTRPEDWREFNQYLTDRGITPWVAKQNAWYPSRAAGDWHLRAVIPATSRDPANRFWQARLIREIHDDTGNASTDSAQITVTRRPPPRYHSPAAARGDAIVVVHPDDTHDPRMTGSVLVEGPFDALAAADLGLVGVALMGNTPSDESLEHAAQWLSTHRPVFLVTDLDAVQRGTTVLTKLLTTYGLSGITVLTPYPHKDLAEAPRAFRREMFLRALKNSG